MKKFNKVQVTRKGKKNFVKVFLNQVEQSKEKVQFDAEITKKSTQPMNASLDKAWSMLTPHLMYGSELVDTSIILDESIDERKWFEKLGWNEEERFQGVVVEELEFIGNNDIIEAVKIKGYRETQLTEKPFKVKIETPVINFDRAAENSYPLLVILEEQVDAINEGLKSWYIHGETLSKAQMSAFVPETV